MESESSSGAPRLPAWKLEEWAQEDPYNSILQRRRFPVLIAALRAERAVATDLAIALHHCSVYLPLFIEDGRRLDRALAVNEQVHAAMDAYCDLTGTRQQDLNDRTVSPKDRP